MIQWTWFNVIAAIHLHCQLVVRISGNTLQQKHIQWKIPIVPEEGWFGQLKYNTLLKKDSTLCRFCLCILDYSSERLIDHR